MDRLDADLVTDQQRDHRQDDGAGESREIAELAGPEREARIVGVLAGVGVGERREQQRTRMRAHMHAVGHQRDRAEQQAADNLGDHHGAAEPDHRPCPALAVFVARAEKHVGMRSGAAGTDGLAHGGAHLR